jgi:PAS domain S-box-containing protein
MPDRETRKEWKRRKKEGAAASKELRKARLDMRRELRRDLRRRRRQARRTPVRYTFWGLMLILWAVLILLVLQGRVAPIDLWKALITGLGGIFLVQSLIYYLVPSYREYAFSRLIAGFIFTFVGLGLVLNFNTWWPLALVVAGVAVVAISWLLQREIEKRRVTQETLRESEVKYRHIIDNANSVIMELDTAGKITFMNRFALDFFGYQENEILGRNMIGTITAAGPYAFTGWEDMIKDIVASPERYLHNESENLRRDGRKAWMIWTYRPILDEDGNLIEILCTAIDRTQHKEAEQAAARQIKEQTAIEERTRLARDLHDAVSQTLFSTSLIAEVLPRLWERNKEDGLKKLEEVRLLTRGALAEMRTLLFELRPDALAGADLNELLRQLAESVIGRAQIPVDLKVDGASGVPVDVKVALYRIAQEALNNIVKHSGASRAQVSLLGQPHVVTLQIIDNGRGFDMSRVAAGSFGLSNMKERAGQIGASLHIESNIDGGTRVTVDWHDNAWRNGNEPV